MQRFIKTSSGAIARHTARAFATITAAMLSVIALSPAVVLAEQDISNAPLGKVLSSVAFSLPSELQGLATAKRVTYVSSDSNGTKIPVTGVVFTPTTPNQHKDIVAWAHGTAGIADVCAPSVNSETFYPEAVDAIRTYLTEGWTVSATDYAGLGSDGDHPYIMGDSEGRAVIDSIRAARFLDSSLSNKWVAAGHSQGGQAALFAGEIADTYGNGLKLKGVAAIAPASNIDAFATFLPGTPANGYLVLALYGLAAVDSSVVPEQLLAQPALDRVNAGALDNCGDVAILNAFGDLSATDLVVGGALPESVVAKFAQYGNPAQQVSSVPVFLAQGTVDEVVPVELTQYLHYGQECAVGSVSFLQEFEGQDHIGSVFASEGAILQFFQDRFDGVPATSNC